MSSDHEQSKHDQVTEVLIVSPTDDTKLYKTDSWERKPTKSVLRADRRTLLVTLCILVMEMCERVTYYSISAGLILFCTSKLGFNQVDASTINQVFSGFVYIIPIVGGFISDSYAGRFPTILGSCFLYLAGVVLLTASAIDYSDWSWNEVSTKGRVGIFMTGLVFVALGTGGSKPSVGPFGAEQVNALGKEAVQSFFNWFYWVINVGAFIAFVGVAYIQQEISFAWGFFVPMASMFLAVITFAVVRTKYIRTAPKGSILTTAWQIVRQGACKCRQPELEPNSKLPEGSETKILARAKKSFGGDHEDHLVDGVVSVIKVTPFCLLIIMYYAICAQMSNTFFAQTERMDVRLGGGVNIPAAALNAFNTIAVIILIPFVDRIVYPCFEKMGKPLTYLKKIGIGLVLSVVAIVVAGIIEIYRKEELYKPGGMHVQVLAGENFTASSMSVFLQIPQFALFGASEIFTCVPILEFAYNQAPVTMQGLLTGLFLASSGVGSWVSSAILSIVEKATEDDPWWSDEINDAKMENLMFLLGGLMGLNFIAFCIVAHYYTYQDPATFEKAGEIEVKVETGALLDGYEKPNALDMKNAVNGVTDLDQNGDLTVNHQETTFIAS